VAAPSAAQIGEWNREFRELGAESVRSALLVKGQWAAEKRQAAKRWLEHTDAANWQAERPPESDSGTFFMNLRSAKWWGIITGLLFFGFSIFRLLRRI
jgi:hypothetical protein